MNAQIIVQLILALGPAAFELIESLIDLWSKPTLSLEEVKAIMERAKKSYDDYIKGV